MCEKCKSSQKEFWETLIFIPLQEFERQEETYNLILNQALKTSRYIYLPLNKIDKGGGIKTYVFFNDKNCLAVLSQNDFDTGHNIIGGRLFWKHRIWAGLMVFGLTMDGLTVKKTKTGRELTEILGTISTGKLKRLKRP